MRWLMLMVGSLLLSCSDTESGTDSSQLDGGILDSGGGPESETQGSASSIDESADDQGDSNVEDGGGESGVPDVLGDLGCDKVDFLFVIDSSISMEPEQSALIASFPGFIDTIQAELTADNDYHILITDTDGLSRCTPETCADPDEQVQELCWNDGIGGYACTAVFEVCDATLGAGVLNPSGQGASNQACPTLNGDRYLTTDEPDLAGSFACIAQVGLAGHPSERPMDAMIAALSELQTGSLGCNSGWLRDDALLVITFVSDDPKYEDALGPQDWYEAVVNAKLGNAQGVVVLGLIPNAETKCAQNSNPDDPGGSHWREFIELWGEHGVAGDVCEESYVSFFQDAVAIIDAACDGFEPPG